MAEFTYRKTSGDVETLHADQVTFETNHVVFWDTLNRVVLAEQAEQVHGLREMIPAKGRYQQ